MSTTNSTKPAVEYRNIPGFPNHRAGSDGTVWSNYVPGRPPKRGPWWQMSANPDTEGYLRVGISRNGKSSSYKVHHLILLAFVGPRPPGLQCRHLDGNPLNNHLTNLRWGTPKEDGEDRVRHGRMPKGEDFPQSKLTNVRVFEIRQKASRGKTLEDLAVEYGVSSVLVGQVVRGEIWRHVGGPTRKSTSKRINKKYLR